MLYAKTLNGQALAFPYTDRDLRRDNRNVSFPSDLDDVTRAEYQMVPVIPAEIPEGKISTGSTAQWIEGAWRQVHELADMPVTPDMIDAERDRRIAAGFTFSGVTYQSRDEDRENITGASLAALAAIGGGATAGDYRWHGGASDFQWIAADNSLNTMDAQTMFAFGQAAMAHKQAHIFAARALKDADPIPADYADDGYWPS